MIKYSLSQLEGCFEGAVPAKIATCSMSGIPNASYLSHVYYIDEKHIAVSYQFFNKTRANLLENPFASIQVRQPCSMQAFRLSVKYLRSEQNGPIFEKMAVKLDVIAASEGMGEIFKLKAADIYEVLDIEEMNKISQVNSACETSSTEDLELIRVISDKLNLSKNMEELFDMSLELLNQYMGWTHMILLLADPSTKNLLTHATFGYQQSGIGSEVNWGKGLIGLCAQHHRALQISGLREGVRYAQAVKKTLIDQATDDRIALPGLANPAAQTAVPIQSFGELQGVLFVESETKSYWNRRDLLILSVFANILALGLRSFANTLDVIRPLNLELKKEDEKPIEWNFRYVDEEDVIFVNNNYLIKNIPAKILRYLIESYCHHGRTEFSNMELRAEKNLQLPDYKDNLEARLILLRKRLEDQDSGIRLISTGRGKFKITITGQITLS